MLPGYSVILDLSFPFGTRTFYNQNRNVWCENRPWVGSEVTLQIVNNVLNVGKHRLFYNSYVYEEPQGFTGSIKNVPKSLA